LSESSWEYLYDFKFCGLKSAKICVRFRILCILKCE
jgi:hypothetical protein